MFNEQTYEVIKQRILDNITIAIDKREGSFVNAMVSPNVEELEKAYVSIGDILNLVFIEDGFDTFLDKRVADFGVYRKIGSKSTGSITVAGLQGEIIDNGTIITTSNGLKYQVLNDVVLSDIDNILHVEALEIGSKYNLLANTIFNLLETNSNITSLTNLANFSGGIDVESDEDLRERFKKIVNNPTTSGNKAHYQMWALECQGVGKAMVYPLHEGNGTVKVVIIGNDNKSVSNEIVANVQTYIEEMKPIGCSLTVTTPSALDVVITGSIKLQVGYSIEDIKLSFENSLNEYLKDITTELTYSKVYGLLASQLGIGDIQNLSLNGATNNITIPSDKLINISSLILSEVV